MSIASFSLDSVGLTAHQLAACNRAGLATAADVLLPSANELNRKLKFHRLDGVNDLIKAVSRGILPSAKTVDAMLEQAEAGWISTGDQGMDKVLGGGLRVGTITEFTGESAAGKSHICLSLALAAQIPSLNHRPGGTMILTSEREIATDRLLELAHHLLAAHDTSGQLRPAEMLDNVVTNLVADITMLEHTLAYKVPHILRARNGIDDVSPLLQRPEAAHIVPPEQPTDTEEDADAPAADEVRVRQQSAPATQPIRLLIIDSITALVRGADSNYANSTSAGLTERSKYLCAIADKLKTLAVEFNLAIVVINQVSDVFSRGPPSHAAASQPSSTQVLSQFFTEGPEPPMLYATQARWFSGTSDSLRKEASLGIVWANAVNVRIMLSRTGRRRLLRQSDLSRVKRPKASDQHVATAEDEDDAQPTLIRRMHVVFSPFAPPATIDYAITTSGVHSLPGSYRLIDVAEIMRRRERLAKAIMRPDSPEKSKVPVDVAGMDRLESMLSDGFDEFEGEILDDLGDFPAEFWRGNFDETNGENGGRVNGEAGAGGERSNHRVV